MTVGNRDGLVDFLSLLWWARPLETTAGGN